MLKNSPCLSSWRCHFRDGYRHSASKQINLPGEERDGRNKTDRQIHGEAGRVASPVQSANAERPKERPVPGSEPGRSSAWTETTPLSEEKDQLGGTGL